MGNKQKEKDDCIVLNKSFVGSYVNDEENNAHEIINFFTDDKGRMFVYCNPYGQNVSKSEKYNIKYFCVTSRLSNDYYFLEYVFKVKRPLHNVSIERKKINDKAKMNEYIQNAEEQIKQTLHIESLDEITYSGVPIESLFTDNIQTIPVTFEIDQVFKIKEGKQIKIEQVDIEDEKLENTKKGKDYNFQRNFGYVLKRKNAQTYKRIEDEIKKIENWEEVTLEKMDFNKIKTSSVNFMNLIGMHREEDCYTKILYTMLSKKDSGLLQAFINLLKDNNTKLFTKKLNFNDLDIKKEFDIGDKNGRMDLFITGANFNIVIENKVDSGINYITKNKVKINQLSRYREYLLSEEIKKEINLIFILCPTSNKQFIEQEIERLNDNNKNEYHVITYELISQLLQDEKMSSYYKKDNFVFYKYFDDIKNIFEYLTFDNKTRCEMNLKTQRIIKGLKC